MSLWWLSVIPLGIIMRLSWGFVLVCRDYDRDFRNDSL